MVAQILINLFWIIIEELLNFADRLEYFALVQIAFVCQLILNIIWVLHLWILVIILIEILVILVVFELIRVVYMVMVSF